MALRIAICSKILQDYEISEAVSIAAEIGYEGIEVFGVEKHLPADVSDGRVRSLAGQLRNAGMECVTLCTYIGAFSQKSDDECLRDVEHFRRYMDIAEELECDMIRVQPGGPPKPTAAREDHWERAAFYLRECCDLALSRDLGVVMENNFGLSATCDATLEMIARVDRPNLGINYDPGNLYRLDRYYGIEALARFGEFVWNVQVKDCYHDDSTDDYQLLLGEGEVDYGSIFAWLNENDYDGHVSAESHKEPTDDLTAVDIARHEYKAIRSLIESI
ncbi:MAG: sugar phosphate isomerase/epimerase [candidate division WS1 bacterium]|jgi:sugar phosphate isomerase/epimerase|nr:sugar phosphate isomerase/epimerase [candidate division WS1 bacterium]